MKPPLPESEWTPGQREVMAAWHRRFIRDRHEQCLRSWKERQWRERGWINFSDIADWCSRKHADVERDAVRRAQAWHDLMEAVLAGEFDRAGRCCVAYLPEGHTDSSKPLWLRLRPDELRRWRQSIPVTDFAPSVLSDCWAPRAICLRWLLARDIRPPSWLDPSGVARETSKVPAKRCKNVGGRPRKWDWPAFDRELVRLANMPDGLPERHVLMRRMLDWCDGAWGDTPSESMVRKHIADRYPE